MTIGNLFSLTVLHFISSPARLTHLLPRKKDRKQKQFSLNIFKASNILWGDPKLYLTKHFFVIFSVFHHIFCECVKKTDVRIKRNPPRRHSIHHFFFFCLVYVMSFRKGSQPGLRKLQWDELMRQYMSGYILCFV